MADYNTLNLQQKITGAMPGALANYGVSNPPTTANDRDALNQGIGSLDASIIFLKSQAQTLATVLGISLNAALNYTIPIGATAEGDAALAEFAPFIPPGYTISSFTIQEVLDVSQGVKSEFINLEAQLQQGNIIPQDGLGDDEPTDDPDEETPPRHSQPPPTGIEATGRSARESGGTSGSGTSESFKQNLLSSIFDQLTGRVYLRDWQHAAKTFIPGNFGNAGKVKFTFHTYFSINEQAYQPPTGQNYGLLVKSIKLPTFNMEVQELNQYNRKRLIQSKIKYQPIDITFHDDNASQITAMWDAYYRYNFADAWNPMVDPNGTQIKNFNRRNIYDPSISGDTEYGYRGDARGPGGDRADGGEKIPFFNNITVYGLWAGQFISYTLINPIITSMDHDTYDYADGGGTMQNRMTIDYETVVYNTGKINEGEEGSLVPGFQAPANYDNRESPLEQGGSSPGDILGRISSLGGDDSILEKARTIGQLYDGGLDTVIDSAKKQVREGLQEAVLGALGLGGDTNFPTNSSSPAMVNIANQGVVTGANNTTSVPASSDPKTAGEQVKGLVLGVLGLD